MEMSNTDIISYFIDEYYDDLENMKRQMIDNISSSQYELIIRFRISIKYPIDEIKEPITFDKINEYKKHHINTIDKEIDKLAADAEKNNIRNTDKYKKLLNFEAHPSNSLLLYFIIFIITISIFGYLICVIINVIYIKNRYNSLRGRYGYIFSGPFVWLS